LAFHRLVDSIGEVSVAEEGLGDTFHRLDEAFRDDTLAEDAYEEEPLAFVHPYSFPVLQPEQRDEQGEHYEVVDMKVGADESMVPLNLSDDGYWHLYFLETRRRLPFVLHSQVSPSATYRFAEVQCH
jgi:hypothetical protein